MEEKEKLEKELATLKEEKAALKEVVDLKDRVEQEKSELKDLKTRKKYGKALNVAKRLGKGFKRMAKSKGAKKLGKSFKKVGRNMAKGKRSPASPLLFDMPKKKASRKASNPFAHL